MPSYCSAMDYDTFDPGRDFKPHRPKWEQIAELIEAKIRSGDWASNYLISEVQLMGKFEVSRPTIRKAMQRLRDLELIFTVPNLGSFVADRAGPTDSHEGEA